MVSETARKIALAVGGLVLALLLLALALYAMDYGMGATVTDKGQDSQGRYIVLTTDLLGIEVTRYLPATQWAAVQEGFYVVYHVKSGHTEVYASEGGRLIWEGS